MLVRLFAHLALWAASAVVAHAITFVISPGPPAVTLQIGSAGGTIDTVAFVLSATNMGSGTPVVGTPGILVSVSARGPTPHAAQLTVDSSSPLSNGASTLSFTSIGWTASDSDIPSGSFSGTSGQLIVQFTTNQQLFNVHTFTYANTQILQPGTYTGRVTYTVTIP